MNMSIDELIDELIDTAEDEAVCFERGADTVLIHKKLIELRDELQQRVGTLENIIENYKTVLDANKEKLKEYEDEILKLRGRVIEIQAKAASFKERAIHADRLERKQAWDEIVAKFTDMEAK